MLIDCHVHLNNYDETVERPVGKVAETLFTVMAASGIAHAVVLTSYKVTPGRRYVERVLESVGRDPRITVVAGIRWRVDRERTDPLDLEVREGAGRSKGIDDPLHGRSGQAAAVRQ